MKCAPPAAIFFRLRYATPNIYSRQSIKLYRTFSLLANLLRHSARWLSNTWKSFYRFAVSAVAFRLFESSNFSFFLFFSFSSFSSSSSFALTTVFPQRKWGIRNAFPLNLMIARRGEHWLVRRSHLHAYASHKLPRTSVPFTKLSLDESNRLITICLPYAEFYTSGLQ